MGGSLIGGAVGVRGVRFYLLGSRGLGMGMGMGSGEYRVGALSTVWGWVRRCGLCMLHMLWGCLGKLGDGLLVALWISSPLGLGMFVNISWLEGMCRREIFAICKSQERYLGIHPRGIIHGEF